MLIITLTQHVMIKLIKNIKCYILFLITFSFLNTVNSQNYERIKNQNVVFIKYEKQKNVVLKTAMGSYETNPDRKSYLYQFFSFNSKGEKHKLPIMTLVFKIYETISKDKELIMFRVNKRFLKNNKEIIMDWDFIKKIGRKKTVDILKNADKILLIDTEQTKNRTIFIKEVYLNLPVID